MKLKIQLKKWENWIIALVVVLVLGVCAGVAFDYYYDLNDDVLMKDILAGVYTGIPEGHNIQMLWLVSAFISMLYRLVGTLPWYGIFLCACHFGCVLLLVKRGASLCKSIWGKLGIALTAGILFAAFYMEHLIFAQYTITCTLLGATAAFLFYTTDIELGAGEFIKQNLLSVILVAIAYLIRSEMLLLVLPMICVAGVAKWGSEKKIFTKDHAIKYLSVIGLILLGLLIGQATHAIAYSSPEWKTFNEFFDNRTELYDFQVTPSYEEHKEFYDGIGLSKSEQILFDNYNFGMDEEIDEKLVGEVAAYAGLVRQETTPFKENVIEKVKYYIYLLSSGRGETGSDYPWNYLVLLGYLAVFIMALPRRESDDKKSYLVNGLKIAWKLAFLFAVRTVLWMYILFGERNPPRITHSLYLMEFCILAAMLFMEVAQVESKRLKTVLAALSIAIFTVFGVIVLPDTLSTVAVQQQLRQETNAPYKELFSYLTSEEHKGNFYFIDVYSSVSYSEKMFEDVDNSLDNYDIMGGWACKSPLQRKKLAAFSIVSMEQALKDREDVYFVRKTSEDMQWLYEYYEGHGTPVDTVLVDVIAGEFEVYSVVERDSK